MAQHAKHGSPEQTRAAKKNLKARRKRLAREQKQLQKLERKRTRQKRGHKPLKAFAAIVLALVVLPVAGMTLSAANPAFAAPVITALQPALAPAEQAFDKALSIGGFDPVFSTADSAGQGDTVVDSPSDDATGANDSAATSASTTATGMTGVSDRTATGSSASGSGSSASSAAGSGTDHDSPSPTAGPTETSDAADPDAGAQCYLIAQCQGVDIYSPIMQKDITGILFHQASYEWAQVMTTQLPEADMEKLNTGEEYLHANNEQTEGTWADAEIAHLYRETDGTPMDTSIDCGAAAGTTVYAPVTGEVLAVTDYDLYDELPDVRIHIRPDANPDLDVVLLHQTDPQVKAGDRVEAGVTPISSVRDIASALTDVQLGFYTEPGDPGNHSHVQVNSLNDQAYLDKYFDGKRPDK